MPVGGSMQAWSSGLASGFHPEDAGSIPVACFLDRRVTVTFGRIPWRIPLVQILERSFWEGRRPQPVERSVRSRLAPLASEAQQDERSASTRTAEGSSPSRCVPP